MYVCMWIKTKTNVRPRDLKKDAVKEEVGHRDASTGKTSNVRANMMDRHYDVI